MSLVNHALAHMVFEGSLWSISPHHSIKISIERVLELMEKHHEKSSDIVLNNFRNIHLEVDTTAECY